MHIRSEFLSSFYKSALAPVGLHHVVTGGCWEERVPRKTEPVSAAPTQHVVPVCSLRFCYSGSHRFSVPPTPTWTLRQDEVGQDTAVVGGMEGDHGEGVRVG